MTKLTLYRALLPPVLHEHCQAPMQLPWQCSKKVLRKTFGPVRIGYDCCFRTNWQLYELFNDMDVAKRINIQRFRWLGHIVRMDEAATPRQVFDAVVVYFTTMLIKC